MADSMSLGGVQVGAGSRPFVVAEMSGNHNHSLARAKAIIDAATDAGVHGLKLQTYTADTLTLDASSPDFLISDKQSLWYGRTLHDLYREAMTPWEWHEELFTHARDRGLVVFSTPFDESSVDFLEDIDAPCYKIASFENAHLPLIRKAASTGKPLIISTGMASLKELEEAVETARGEGCDDLILLKCTSSYPATSETSNVMTIPDLRERFGCQVGLSDHTLGVGASVAAVALGATFIEKHFTLTRAEGGVDAAFSMEPAEMAQLVVESERAWQSLGRVEYGPTEAEKPSLRFRRSIYVAEDTAAGQTLSPENLRIVRPGYGLHPRHYDELLGKTLVRDVKKGERASWDMIGR